MEEFTMSEYINVAELKVSRTLYDFINTEALPNTGIEQDYFWRNFNEIINDLTPRNKQLLEERETIQKKISAWHKENKEVDLKQYKDFLKEIDYLEPKVEDFKVSTKNVDNEVAHQAGPQLVVPVNNARYALNAANARWGSLYDALYGTDVISNVDGAEKGASYNPIRGNKVIAESRDFLNRSVPLASGSHHHAIKYFVENGSLAVTLTEGKTVGLR